MGHEKNENLRLQREFKQKHQHPQSHSTAFIVPPAGLKKKSKHGHWWSKGGQGGVEQSTTTAFAKEMNMSRQELIKQQQQMLMEAKEIADIKAMDPVSPPESYSQSHPQRVTHSPAVHSDQPPIFPTPTPIDPYWGDQQPHPPIQQYGEGVNPAVSQ